MLSVTFDQSFSIVLTQCELKVQGTLQVEGIAR